MEQATALLTELGVQHSTGIVWPSAATKSRVYAFANDNGTSLNPSTSCPKCDLQVVDVVRKAAGLTALAQEARTRVILERKRLCQGGDGKTAVLSTPCPAYHPSTDSCGRVVLDALPLVREEVEVGGVMVQPCGCRLFGLFGKARLSDSKCPAGKW